MESWANRTWLGTGWVFWNVLAPTLKEPDDNSKNLVLDKELIARQKGSKLFSFQVVCRRLRHR